MLYPAIDTRFDISLAVNKVSQFSNNFHEIHCTAVKCIAKYLRDTTDYALCHFKFDANNILTTYADDDYVGDLDDHKSCGRVVNLLNKHRFFGVIASGYALLALLPSLNIL